MKKTKEIIMAGICITVLFTVGCISTYEHEESTIEITGIYQGYVDYDNDPLIINNTEYRVYNPDYDYLDNFIGKEIVLIVYVLKEGESKYYDYEYANAYLKS